MLTKNVPGLHVLYWLQIMKLWYQFPVTSLLLAVPVLWNRYALAVMWLHCIYNVIQWYA